MSGDPRDRDNRGYGYGGYERPSRKREAPVGGDSNRDKRTGPGQVRRAGGSSGTKRSREEPNRYNKILVFTLVMQGYCFILAGSVYLPNLSAYDCSKVEQAELRSAACLHSKVDQIKTVKLLGLAETDFLLTEAVTCEARFRIDILWLLEIWEEKFDLVQ